MRYLNVLKFVLFGLMLSSSWQASSSIIPYNGYELNGNVVSKGNLEWLQWSETSGDSISSALASYSQYGWELASNAQVNNLFEDFGFSAAPNENGGVITFSPYTNRVGEPYDRFIQLFGETLRIVYHFTDDSDNDYNRAAAFYGSDEDMDSLFDVAYVVSDFVYEFLGRGALMVLKVDVVDVNSIANGHGVALVRTIEVDEPSAFVIIALGIMGLATRRFKKQS
jgi:hypothetical protein